MSAISLHRDRASTHASSFIKFSSHCDRHVYVLPVDDVVTQITGVDASWLQLSRLCSQQLFLYTSRIRHVYVRPVYDIPTFITVVDSSFLQLSRLCLQSCSCVYICVHHATEHLKTCFALSQYCEFLGDAGGEVVAIFILVRVPYPAISS